MERKQRQQTVLAVLLVMLAAVVVYEYWMAPSGRAVRTSNPARGSAAGTAVPGGRLPAAPEVRLDALKAAHEPPLTTERNLFRFKPTAPPAVPPRPAATTGGAAGGTGTPAPTGPPPPAPIPLKFIGIVESPDRTHKIAVLSDGRAVHEGKEGDTILGQYKILHIGVESIEMAYLDGRGRQTIRLTGS